MKMRNDQYPIIILEGMDICGKSTLTTQLSKVLGPGVVCHHSGSPPKLESVKETQEWEENNYSILFDQFLLLSSNTPVIADRFHVGAAVYGKLFRNYSDNYHCSDLEKYFEYYESENVFLVIITDYPDAIAKRDDGLSLETTVEQYELTRQSFITEYHKSTINNKLLLNVTDNGGFVNLLPTIKQFVGIR